MYRLKRWILMLFLLFVFVLSIGFSLWNTAPVSLSLGVHELDERPLAFWMIAAFCMGGIAGMIVGTGLINNVRFRLRIRSLEKELLARPKFVRRETESKE